ncbi:MAG: peptidoglycan-binding protein [Clostridia bacterium]|nr:peptidoglycan-binding protein [Clostridia bacterium]
MYEMNDNAAAIAAIQRLLRDAGYDIKPDGIYGEETYSAVRQFQSENSIPPTGRVDLATFEALAIAARPKPTYRCALIIPQILESGVISPGDKSSVVTIIQAVLKTLEIIYEYDSIELTGVYDQNTEAAVRDIQRINSLPITGIIDAPTWNALVSEYEKYRDSE